MTIEGTENSTPDSPLSGNPDPARPASRSAKSSTILTRRRLLLLWLILAAAAIPLTVRLYHHYHRRASGMPSSPPRENTGDFAGPLTRPAIAYNPSRPPSRPWLDPKRTAPSPLAYHTFAASAIGGRETFCLLYLPPGYNDPANAARRYPVIYWLHGYLCEPQHGTPFIDALDAAIRAGRIGPTIAVIPNGLVDSWFVDTADGSQPVESIIIKDLIPHIDANYRTIPDRRARAVEGFSMGAWGAGHLAFKYPELFSAVTMVSAPFQVPEEFWQLQRIFAGDPAAYYAEDPVTRARRDPARLAQDVRIRMICGDKDQLGHYGDNIAFDKRLTQWQIPHEFKIVPGVGHSDADIYERLGPGAFDFYKEAFEALGR